MLRRSGLLLLVLTLGCVTTSNRPTALPAVAPAPVGVEQPPLAELVSGKVVLIDMWATWCEPCVAAIPKLKRLAAAYGPKGLVVVGVNVGEAPDVVKKFAEETSIDYPLYVDPEFRFADALGARKVPTLLVLDGEGRIVGRSSELTKSTLEQLRELLR